MTDPDRLTERQRRVLLWLACTPPGQWARLNQSDRRTARSLARRGLVEIHGTDDASAVFDARLNHNNAYRMAPTAIGNSGGAPV